MLWHHFQWQSLVFSYKPKIRCSAGWEGQTIKNVGCSLTGLWLIQWQCKPPVFLPPDHTPDPCYQHGILICKCKPYKSEGLFQLISFTVLHFFHFVCWDHKRVWIRVNRKNEGFLSMLPIVGLYINTIFVLIPYISRFQLVWLILTPSVTNIHGYT